MIACCGEERERTAQLERIRLYTILVRKKDRKNEKRKRNGENERKMKRMYRTKIEPKPKLSTYFICGTHLLFTRTIQTMFIYTYFLLLFRLERYTGAYTHHREIGVQNCLQFGTFYAQSIFSKEKTKKLAPFHVS